MMTCVMTGKGENALVGQSTTRVKARQHHLHIPLIGYTVTIVVLIIIEPIRKLSTRLIRR